ncbi:HAD-IB family hydrolase [Streptomyces sp. LP11]|uniref:HAD-IB family hydrolase n=1 Tax=Streptomyces pyxinicus TaxID=2970331 RepID=A0ABT2BD62_9ACTN|nr:HAD-IB family hydrolase [Streptomyces sp. LP11]MCS0606471.1 HAD-IB family hydrolase [Streptomyces sp. LP11]
MIRRIAFFDLDETLLAQKSMLSFWHHWTDRLVREGRTPPVLRSSGADRATLNRGYFGHFAGVPLARLEAAARQWYAEYRTQHRAYVAGALDALERHHRDGHETALVTGSGRALVQPVAEHLGIRHVLATEQLTDAAGTLTGEVRRSMIGPAKAEGVAALIRRRGVRPGDCFAYGDHSSDLPMLALVGHPVVVGEDPVLRAHGAARGWRVIGTHACPHPDNLVMPAAS